MWLEQTLNNCTIRTSRVERFVRALPSSQGTRRYPETVPTHRSPVLNARVLILQFPYPSGIRLFRTRRQKSLCVRCDERESSRDTGYRIQREGDNTIHCIKALHSNTQAWTTLRVATPRLQRTPPKEVPVLLPVVGVDETWGRMSPPTDRRYSYRNPDATITVRRIWPRTYIRRCRCRWRSPPRLSTPPPASPPTRGEKWSSPTLPSRPPPPPRIGEGRFRHRNRGDRIVTPLSTLPPTHCPVWIDTTAVKY